MGVDDVVDTKRAEAGDEAKRWISAGEENHSEERPLSWLPEQTLVSSHRWRSQLPSGLMIIIVMILSF